LLCGLAPSLPILIFARVLQGLGGGGLAPSEQAILADTFSVADRGKAFALYGMAVVVAPAIGPTLGGYITDNFNWHWIFFINLPIGLFSLWLSNRMVEDPPGMKERMKQRLPIDFTGLALVAGGVGTLEFFFDKGQEKDWFGSPMIVTAFVIAVVLLIVFVFWEWNHPDPIVDLRLLQNRNFGTAVFLQLVLGMVLFGSTVLIPQFLQNLLGYTAERAGMVLSPGGFILVFMMAIAGRTVGKMDPRLMVCLGYIAVSMGLYNLTRLSLDSSFGTITLWRMLQVAGLPFVFIPISTLNYVGVPRSKSNQISSLSNFARNLGGSSGTAMLTTFLARTSQTHQQQLASNTGVGSIGYTRYLAAVSGILRQQGMSAAQATQTAIGEAYQEMLRQASMLAYKNAFAVLAGVILCLTPLPFLMRLPQKAEKPAPEELAAH
jgi:DHA2 family multidrug resistance protein